MRIAVMVDVERIQPGLKKMSDLITAHGARLGIPTEENDDLGNLMVMGDMVNHHLATCLTDRNPTANIGIDGYLQDYYPRVAPALLQSPEVLSFMGSQFAQVIGVLAESLQPAVHRLGEVDQCVDEIVAYGVKPGELALYMVDGEPWDTGTVEC